MDQIPVLPGFKQLSITGKMTEQVFPLISDIINDAVKFINKQINHFLCDSS